MRESTVTFVGCEYLVSVLLPVCTIDALSEVVPLLVGFQEQFTVNVEPEPDALLLIQVAIRLPLALNETFAAVVTTRVRMSEAL